MCINQWLTLGPGGPTLPAAPGKPVAPWNKEHHVNSKTYTINLPLQIHSSIEHDHCQSQKTAK